MRTPHLLLAGLLLATWSAVSGADNDWSRVPAAEFESVLAESEGDNLIELAAFELETMPVSNREFLAFLKAHPDWRRDRVAPLFADEKYLSQWQGPLNPGDGQLDLPVTRVSWFAALAYCEARGARLPTWYEWEWVAAADGSRADARTDPLWRQRILSWYSKTGGELRPVASGNPNLYGIYDLHDLVWEWVDDFGALIVAADNRTQGDPDQLKFCGAGALSMEMRENYAVLMRIAMLSSLQASYTTANLGFRCARSVEEMR
ncbi:MAG: formylglycine-generating enzyme family protein [Pseudomonadales bacterium]|nr:formylglycine-generating enzyme family protein [Pseudomonadales bacterium]